MREYLSVDCVNRSSKSPEKCRLGAKSALEAQVVRNLFYLFIYLFVYFFVTSLYQGCNRGLFSLFCCLLSRIIVENVFTVIISQSPQ